MIKLPEGITRDDVGQWLYGGVCVYEDPSGNFIPAIMDNTVDDAGVDRARIRLLTDGFEGRRYVTIDSLWAHWPLCGSVNVEAHKCAIHVERLPARQYKRTFNNRQVKVHLPRGWDLRKRLGSHVVTQMMQVSTETVRALFLPSYPESVEAAFERLGNGYLSVALNPRVIVAGDDLGKRMVYYRGQLAATMQGEYLSPVADLTTCRIINRSLNGRFRWNVEL